jgi:hypothetical protein
VGLRFRISANAPVKRSQRAFRLPAIAALSRKGPLLGQADVYQMMAYARVYNSNSLMLLYPHHDELGIGEGLLTLHRIADKKDSRLAIATIALSDPKSVGMRLRRLLLGEAEVFNLAME